MAQYVSHKKHYFVYVITQKRLCSYNKYTKYWYNISLVYNTVPTLYLAYLFLILNIFILYIFVLISFSIINNYELDGY